MMSRFDFCLQAFADKYTQYKKYKTRFLLILFKFGDSMAYIRVIHLQNNSVSSNNLFAFYCCFTQIRLQNNVGSFAK